MSTAVVAAPAKKPFPTGAVIKWTAIAIGVGLVIWLIVDIVQMTSPFWNLLSQGVGTLSAVLAWALNHLPTVLGILGAGLFIFSGLAGKSYDYIKGLAEKFKDPLTDKKAADALMEGLDKKEVVDNIKLVDAKVQEDTTPDGPDKIAKVDQIREKVADAVDISPAEVPEAEFNAEEWLAGPFRSSQAQIAATKNLASRNPVQPFIRSQTQIAATKKAASKNPVQPFKSLSMRIASTPVFQASYDRAGSTGFPFSKITAGLNPVPAATTSDTYFCS